MQESTETFLLCPGLPVCTTSWCGRGFACPLSKETQGGDPYIKQVQGGDPCIKQVQGGDKMVARACKVTTTDVCT